MGKKTTKGTKKTKLRRRLKQILESHEAISAYDEIMALIDEYDAGMIYRLERYRLQIHEKERLNVKRISEALKLTIQHHGSITTGGDFFCGQKDICRVVETGMGE